MNIDLQPLLDSVQLFHIVILSTLVGYLLAAPATLRFWIAAQKVTALPAQEDEPITWKKRASINLSALLLFVGIEYPVLVKANGQIVNGVLFGLFGYAIFSSSAALFLNITGMLRWGIHRNTEGAPVPKAIREKRNWRQKSALLAGLLGCIALPVGSFATNNQTLVAISSIALVFHVSRTVEFTSISMRGMIIGLLGCVAGTLLLAAALVLVVFRKRSGNSDSNSPPTNSSSSAEQWMHDFSWVLPPIFAYVPGLFIALCLRFDYQMHLDKSATASEFILCTVPALEPRRGRKQKLGEGVLVPSHAPAAFSKVYYTTVLVAWGVGQLVLPCITAFTSLSLEGTYEFGVLVLLLELPIMCFAVIAVAAVRGEWKKLWRYMEVWTIKPKEKDAPSVESTPLIPKEKEVEL